MLRVTAFVNEEYYHVFSRGVDKRKIFNSDQDYMRFIFLLHLSKSSKSFKLRDFPSQKILEKEIEDANVEIVEWSLMPNHFHLILKQKKDGGIEKYMRKVLTGYSMYFNLKNNRTGALFSGRFKSKHINDDLYFKKVREYVKLNPLEIYFKNWDETLNMDDAQINEKQIKELAEKHLKNFKYSSYNNFIML